MKTKQIKRISIILCVVMLISLMQTFAFAMDDGPIYVESTKSVDYTLPVGETMTLFERETLASNAYYDNINGTYTLIKADIGKDLLYVIESGGRYYAMQDMPVGTKVSRVPAVDVTDWRNEDGTFVIPEDTKNVAFLSYTKFDSNDYGRTVNGHKKLFLYDYESVKDSDNNFLYYKTYIKYEDWAEQYHLNSLLWHNKDSSGKGIMTSSISQYGPIPRYLLVLKLGTNDDGSKYFYIDTIENGYSDTYDDVNAYLYTNKCRHQNQIDYAPYDAPTCMNRGSKEFWYCRGCEEYFSDAEMKNYLGISHPEIDATGHDYGEEACNNCGRKVPVYKKVTSKAEFNNLSENASYIIVAEYDGKTYVLENPNGLNVGMPHDVGYSEVGYANAVPVNKNADGTISVKGLKAMEFERVHQLTADQIDQWLAERNSEYDPSRTDLEAAYQFIVPNGFFSVMSLGTKYRRYMQTHERFGDMKLWYVYFYEEVKNTENIENRLSPHYEYSDENAILNMGWESIVRFSELDLKRAVRLRDYNGKLQFVSGSDWLLDGYNQDEEKQASVYLYASESEITGHIHNYGPWTDTPSDDINHHRTCKEDDCNKPKESEAHKWDNGVIKTEADCIKDGEKIFTCTVCGGTKKEVIKKLEHDFSSAEWNIGGETQHCKICSRCGAYGNYEEHQWGSYTETKAPTYTSEGEKKCACSVCGREKIEKIPMITKVNEKPAGSQDNAANAQIVFTDELPMSTLFNTVIPQQEQPAADSNEAVSIYLVAEDTVPTAEDNESLIQAAGEGSEIGLALNINLMYKVGDETEKQVNNTNGKLAITIEIPEHLRTAPAGMKRTFKVIRKHTETITLPNQMTITPTNFDTLESAVNENGTITFFTDKFSLYALAYNDTVIKTASYGKSGGALKYTVKFETNGGSTIANTSVVPNSKVSEPAAPTKEGFKFDGWYTDKACTKVYDFNSKVTSGMTLYAKWVEEEATEPTEPVTPDKPAVTEWENPFDDVKASDWYYEAVKFVGENKLMNGTADNIFSPNASLTRGMLVTILYRHENEPAVNKSIPFGDVKSDMYYANAVIWAQQNGIVNGVSETEFAPDSNITREEIAVIMYRYAKYKGIAPEGAWAIRLDYADIDEMSDWAADAVMYCKLKEIMGGKENNCFAPKDNATRAEIAAILQRFIEANK